MQCNIDAPGKRIRLTMGLCLSALGGALLALSLTGRLALPWGIGLGLLLVGLFQIYEGWAGWCVIRAMGFKTKY